jgi:CDP-diacylglycerol--glycerol-3-phosphate 3-phosphatidyltransferase/cardiolipin synthase
VRDAATALGFVVAKATSWLRTVTFKARMLGKLVTVLQLVALLVLLLAPRYAGPLVAAVGALSVLAIVDYAYAAWRSRAR